MNFVFVHELKNQSIDQDGSDSAILKLKFYNPTDPILQHLPVKEKS